MAEVKHVMRKPLMNTTMTVEITPVLTREFRVRLWCGLVMLKLALWVLGGNFEFVTGDMEE